jgi:hypothetical protein
MSDFNDPLGRPIPNADYYECGPEVNVFSWSPMPPGLRGKSTQVHLHLGSPPGRVVLVRFKSAKAIDFMIDALVKHREDVWGKP